MTQPNAFENWNQHTGRGDGPLPSSSVNAERQQAQDRRKAFARRESVEMRQARRILLRQAMRWAVLSVVPLALLGWGFAYPLGPASVWISPGWTAPSALVSLILGAVCGALGGAAARILYEVFEEDRDMPLVVMSVATCVLLGAAIHSAGQGAIVDPALAVGGGIPVGIATGFVVYVFYSGLKVLSIWARKEFTGY